MSSTNLRHVVKAYLHEFSCEEWQHIGKPNQHALTLIIAQPTSEIGAQLGKRPVGRQRKNRIKGVLKAGGGKTNLKMRG
jgi:hypothetical protein